MTLFQLGDFALHSGLRTPWKVDCDALTRADLDALAYMLVQVLPLFGGVSGVPRGGLALAARLKKYATHGPMLLVDDVLTTGSSLELHRAAMPTWPAQDYIGAVLFARGPCPAWVTAMFQMPVKPC